jgi:hypothetical protein
MAPALVLKMKPAVPFPDWQWASSIRVVDNATPGLCGTQAPRYCGQRHVRPQELLTVFTTTAEFV